MKNLPIFTQNIPLKNDLIEKIEYFVGVKHCEIFLFIPLFLADTNKNLYFCEIVDFFSKTK